MIRTILGFMCVVALGGCQSLVDTGDEFERSSHSGAKTEEQEKAAKAKLEGCMLFRAKMSGYVHVKSDCPVFVRESKTKGNDSSPTRFWIRNGRIVDANMTDFDGLALCSCCKQ